MAEKPKKSYRPRDKRPRITTSAEWIERGPMVPWMHKYVCWLAEQPDAMLAVHEGEGNRRRGRPYGAERAVKCSIFAGRRIAPQHLTKLEHREDVVAYFNKLRSDAQFKAREMALQTITRNLEAREKGLSKALDEAHSGEAMDAALVERYTRPVIDFALPKIKEQSEEQRAPRITINLIGNQDAQKLLGQVLSGEVDDEPLEYEAIEVKELGDGD